MFNSGRSANILVVAAHPDDEVLGCGGTIARHAEAGHRVDILFMTDGVGARMVGGTEAASGRRAAALKAAMILGAQAPEFLEFPDNGMDSVALLTIVQAIEAVLARRPYEVVYTHSAQDLNIDHVITNRAVRTATRPFPGQTVARVLGFEVVSSTEWSFGELAQVPPGVAVNISGQIERKIVALKAYGAELRAAPHPRSVEVVRALASFRGAAHGFAFGEAFTMLRESLA